MNIDFVTLGFRTPPKGLFGALFDFSILLTAELLTLGTPCNCFPVTEHFSIDLFFLEVLIFVLPPGSLWTFFLIDLEFNDFPVIVEHTLGI